MNESKALITNDAVVLGILMLILAFVFYTSSKKTGFWAKFYSIIPSVFLCYLLPAVLNTFNIIRGDESGLYTITSRYLLPACLVLFTIGIDIPGLRKLGRKSIIMFLAGTFGIMVGGPLALLIVGAAFPDILTFGGEESWRGFSTIAGSWIGGGANQVALKEVFGASSNLFAQVVAVDIIVANIWMGVLLFGTQYDAKINRWLNADNKEIKELEAKMEAVAGAAENRKNGTRELMLLLGVGFALTGLAHLLADILAPFFKENYPATEAYSLTSTFFWIVVLATTFGLILSFTRVRKMETMGASNLGSVFLYVLVATIGMSMDLKALLENPKFFLVGILWMLVHIIFMLLVARLVKAPFFYVAVGSQANVGGAATAPIVAAAFNKYLAPVGVLMAVLGYAVGTYGGYLTGLFLQWVSNFLQ